MNISSEPLQNNVIRKSINGILNTTTMDIIEKVTFEEYESHWRKWLTYDTKNIVNLDKFPYASYTGGSTPSFGEFIVRHNNRRVRGSRNDFILTSILCRTYAKELVYLEDAPIKKNDCVIISLPFSGNGIKYKNMNYLLEQCNLLGVPVMLDASYFGISYGITYPLHYKCITDIVFSHSKNFSLTDARVGIRFTKELIDDTLSAPQIMGDIFNKIGAHIAIELMTQFSHNWFINRYLEEYLSLCKQFGLQHTNTITLALGEKDNPKHARFKRNDYIRICISEELSGSIMS